MHVAIVAVHLYDAGLYEMDPDKAQDDAMDTDREDVLEGAGGQVVMGGHQDEPGIASHTQRDNSRLFQGNVGVVLKLGSLLKFPVEEPHFKPGTFGRPKIFFHESICTSCAEPYTLLPDADATLIAQVGFSVAVFIC